jgi:hypothetical protein
LQGPSFGLHRVDADLSIVKCINMPVQQDTEWAVWFPCRFPANRLYGPKPLSEPIVKPMILNVFLELSMVSWVAGEYFSRVFPVWQGILKGSVRPRD